MHDPLAGIPGPNSRRIAVRIESYAERSIRAGHPWLFEGAIKETSHAGSPGDIAVIFDRKKRFLAAGLFDPSSPIRVRLLVHGRPQMINRDLFASRLYEAKELRRPLQGSATDGFRLVHGANDGMPGLVVDRYRRTLVLKLYSAAWIPHLPRLRDELQSLSDPQTVVLRLSRQLQRESASLFGLADGQTLFGPAPDRPVVFQENDLLFEADVLQGQKTGFFLDQRDNRQIVGTLAAAKKVLNVFSYSGGFSLNAARGGAVSVTDIDQSPHALAAAQRHFALNSDNLTVASARHEIINGDAFTVLSDLAAANSAYDLVVVDPPAFARRKEDVSRALKAYGRLAHMALSVLTPGGILVSSSCSSRVTADEFFTVVNRAARAEGRPLQEIQRTTHALDHPIGFSEGAYLKTLYAVAP